MLLVLAAVAAPIDGRRVFGSPGEGSATTSHSRLRWLEGIPQVRLNVEPSALRAMAEGLGDVGGVCPRRRARGPLPGGRGSAPDEVLAVNIDCSGAAGCCDVSASMCNAGGWRSLCRRLPALSEWLRERVAALPELGGLNGTRLCEFRTAPSRTQLAAVAGSALLDASAGAVATRTDACQLCMDATRQLGTLRCGHRFCQDCALSHILPPAACPACRRAAQRSFGQVLRSTAAAVDDAIMGLEPFADVILGSVGGMCFVVAGVVIRYYPPSEVREWSVHQCLVSGSILVLQAALIRCVGEPGFEVWEDFPEDVPQAQG